MEKQPASLLLWTSLLVRFIFKAAFFEQHGTSMKEKILKRKNEFLENKKNYNYRLHF